jgi:hypothetical protein
MANSWVIFVKKWAAENNKSYMCAITDAKCKRDYKNRAPPSVIRGIQRAKREIAYNQGGMSGSDVNVGRAMTHVERVTLQNQGRQARASQAHARMNPHGTSVNFMGSRYF